MIKKIISGGQTGVDLAALDASLDMKIPYGGWCPKGRMNEKGIISKKYSLLKEVSGTFVNEEESYILRTKRNIRDSDGTLIFVPKIPLPPQIRDGTLLTIKEVKKQKKPYLIIELFASQRKNSEFIIRWIKKYNITVLNIAGPRESSFSGIYKASLKLLETTLPNLSI